MKLGALSFIKEFKFLFNRSPFYVLFYPTSRCNARCPHCFNYKRQGSAAREEELALNEIEKISRNFSHIKVLTVTGGEPFLREDLPEIISIFHKNNGVQYVSFHTNAFLTDTVCSVMAQLMARFREIRFIVCISIDKIGKEHDDFRGVKGGFAKVLETIDKLKKLKEQYGNLSLVSSTIFSHSTMDSFTDTIRFIENDIGGVRPSLSFIRGTVKDKEEKSIDYRRYQDFFDSFSPQGKTGFFTPLAVKESLEMLVNKVVVRNYRHCRQSIPCYSGRKLIVIYENGDVYPCEMLNEKLGNLREVDYDIKRLLCSERAKKIIGMIKGGKFCYCTWENVIPVNLLFSPQCYHKIIYEYMRLLFFKRKNKN